MRGIKNHWRAGFRHLRQRSHVNDERVVAEARSALGDEHVGVAAARHFGDDVSHIPRGEKLPLLDLDDPAGPGGGDEQIGLPAQEGGDLQNVDGLRYRGALIDLVDIGDDRQPQAFTNLGENR